MERKVVNGQYSIFQKYTMNYQFLYYAILFNRFTDIPIKGASHMIITNDTFSLHDICCRFNRWYERLIITKCNCGLLSWTAQYISIYCHKETCPPDKQSTIITPPTGEHALSKPFRCLRMIRQSHIAFASTIVFCRSLNQLVDLKKRNKVSFRSFFITGTPSFYFETFFSFYCKTSLSFVECKTLATYLLLCKPMSQLVKQKIKTPFNSWWIFFTRFYFLCLLSVCSSISKLSRVSS